MDTWTTQRSFPVLTLLRNDTTDNRFTVTQESFLEMKARIVAASENQTVNHTATNASYWKVPFTYINDQSLKTKTVWLSDRGRFNLMHIVQDTMRYCCPHDKVTRFLTSRLIFTLVLEVFAENI